MARRSTRQRGTGPQVRVLAGGSIVLGLAVALLIVANHSDFRAPNGSVARPRVSDRETKVPLPGIPASGSMPLGVRGEPVVRASERGTLSIPPTARQDTMQPVIAASRPRAGEAVEPTARRNPAAGVSAAETPKQATAISVAPMREANPVSRSQAIASTLAGRAYQDMVGPLARLYFAYFDRAPDYEGLNYYIDQRNTGRPLDSIADEFAGSREFDERYGSLDNATFVDRLYASVFGGASDPAQRAYWIGQLDSGAMTRGEIVLTFSESDTFRTLTANEVFVTLAYVEALGRAPEPAELVRWVDFLGAGNPRSAVIDGLLSAAHKK